MQAILLSLPSKIFRPALRRSHTQKHYLRLKDKMARVLLLFRISSEDLRTEEDSMSKQVLSKTTKQLKEDIIIKLQAWWWMDSALIRMDRGGSLASQGHLSRGSSSCSHMIILKNWQHISQVTRHQEPQPLLNNFNIIGGTHFRC